jgi:hypothetical protein
LIYAAAGPALVLDAKDALAQHASWPNEPIAFANFEFNTTFNRFAVAHYFPDLATLESLTLDL